jgi:excisionase family DNA binding protein
VTRRVPVHSAPPPLLTIDVVAERFDVNPRTVRRWIEQGDLSVVRVGSVVRITSDDLDRFIDKHRQTAGRKNR